MQMQINIMRLENIIATAFIMILILSLNCNRASKTTTRVVKEDWVSMCIISHTWAKFQSRYPLFFVYIVILSISSTNPQNLFIIKHCIKIWWKLLN